METRKAITFAELKLHLDAMTPEQLAYPVMWRGEERGGPVIRIKILEDDQINPSGDGMEALSGYVDAVMEDEGISREEAERVARAEESIVAHKGQTLLLVD